MQYRIEKNIPLLESRMGSNNSRKYPIYPFRDMKDGDSFFVPNYCRDKMRSIQTAGRIYYNKMGINLITRVRVEGTGFRVWVIKKPVKQK